MLLLKMVLSTLMIMSISGCECKNPPKPCKTPDIQYPDINNTSCNGDVNCTVIKNLTNYEMIKKYANKLYNANQVCK